MMTKAKPIEFNISEKGCFEVTNHALKRGYPVKSIKGKNKAISRLIYTECMGEIPEGMVVRHTCDNALCINPEHLLLGTQTDNINDRNSRGRSKGGGTPKINEQQVNEIRSLYSEGVKQKDLVEMFKLSKGNISQIVNKKIWQNI